MLRAKNTNMKMGRTTPQVMEMIYSLPQLATMTAKESRKVECAARVQKKKVLPHKGKKVTSKLMTSRFTSEVLLNVAEVLVGVPSVVAVVLASQLRNLFSHTIVT